MLRTKILPIFEHYKNINVAKRNDYLKVLNALAILDSNVPSEVKSGKLEELRKDKRTIHQPLTNTPTVLIEDK